MDLAKSLIRSVARGFYETKHILIVDALMIHSALRDDDLAHLLGMQTKELRKLCAKLEEHRLLAVHNRQETREGMQRLISRTYYYVDFRQTIDAIKYRFYHMTKEVKGMGQPTEEKKDFFCPRCKAQWTQMEVLDNPGPLGFNCNRCQNPLDRDDENVGDNSGTEKSGKLANQLEPLLKMLQKIDESVIPENPFETALSGAIPVSRNQNTNPIAPTAAVAPLNGGAPTAVKGMAHVGPQHIEVDLTSESEKSAAERVAESKRKAALAEQNALPVWHTKSTVTGEATALGSKEALVAKERETYVGGASAADAPLEDKKPVKGEMEMTDEMAKYYADLARENELKAQARADEESFGSGDDEEDEDEDEFEDVPTTIATTINGVPKSSNANGTSMTGIKSEEESESGSSAQPGTNAGTPAAGDEGQEPPAKKVRIEEPVRSVRDEEGQEGIKAEEVGESEEDEEVEFEDV
ncbi:MAG: hypothetical protein M1837_006212 [Sclerophora amabilis]|nr:MAG: hypothetical protein M1837_006212 [Sclerophora amabilis]